MSIEPSTKNAMLPHAEKAGFWARFKEHRLIQTALAYLAAALALAHGEELLATTYGWPELVGQVFIGLLGAGLIATLLVAWLEGRKRLKKPPASRAAAGRMLDRMFLLVLALVIAALVGERFFIRQGASETEISTLFNIVLALLVVVLLADRFLLSGRRQKEAVAAVEIHATGAKPGTICVLPFTNMSGDGEQEYFSDGITEDIITDLSKVSALGVIARNTAFQFKGHAIDVKEVAKQTTASHVLEGSVRKVGNRVRITAQLIDGSTGNHIWAERYDRDLSDIFAVQDEISRAVVEALKLRLLPEERAALAYRGTSNPEAYKLYLMARQYHVKESPRYFPIIVRLLTRATEIDPAYAPAWAKLSRVQAALRSSGHGTENGEAAARRALELNPKLAEAHANLAAILANRGELDRADEECAIALRLDAESWDVNRAAARIAFIKHEFKDAIRYFEKTASIIDSDFASLAMAAQCFKALGDETGAKDAARRALKRIEAEIAAEPDNGSALGHGAVLLAMLGERESTKEWAARAMLVDPDNVNLAYNLGCALVTLGERDAALDYLERFLTSVPADGVNWAKQDTDLDSVRDFPRFKAMVAAAEARTKG